MLIPFSDMLDMQVYFANQHPNFPEGGKMSQYFEGLKIGDEITVKGPLGHFVYEGMGAYVMNNKTKGVAKHLSMLAGGTGGQGSSRASVCFVITGNSCQFLSLSAASLLPFAHEPGSSVGGPSCMQAWTV